MPLIEINKTELDKLMVYLDLDKIAVYPTYNSKLCSKVLYYYYGDDFYIKNLARFTSLKGELKYGTRYDFPVYIDIHGKNNIKEFSDKLIYAYESEKNRTDKLFGSSYNSDSLFCRKPEIYQLSGYLFQKEYDELKTNPIFSYSQKNKKIQFIIEWLIRYNNMVEDENRINLKKYS